MPYIFTRSICSPQNVVLSSPMLSSKDEHNSFLKTQLNFSSFDNFSQTKGKYILNLLHTCVYSIIFILQNFSFQPIVVRGKNQILL